MRSMLGLVLIPLIIGALISSIWGKEAAQGCLAYCGKLVLWGVLGVVIVVVPPVGIVLACGYGLYLLVRHGGKFVESYNDAGREIEHEKQMAERLKAHQAGLDAKAAAEATLANPSSPPGGLIAPRCYRPRKHAPTALPHAPADAEYWAVPIKDAHRQGYVLEERSTGSSVFLSVTEFNRDWIPHDPPLKLKPRPAPVEEKPPIPQWNAPGQRARRP